MVKGLKYAALAGVAAIAVALSVAPGTAQSRGGAISLRADSIGSFTPASADPRMAAAIRRSGISSRGMRFTPSSAGERDRPVTVAIRARGSDAVQARRNAEVAMNASSANRSSIEPIAYNLGVSVGWKRFAISGDLGRVEGGLVPGRSRESADVGVSYSGRRWSTSVRLSADRPTEEAPRIVGNDESVALDVGGSYSIARNIDITGGVRYQMERDRLQALTDERRDSQAVYVGTAFRF